jgi:hypothetical protein
LVSHHYYESVPKINKKIKQEMAQLMCKRKMTKERFSTLTLGRWCVANLALGLEFLKEILNHFD